MERAGIARPRPLIAAHLLLLMAEQPRHGYELAASLRMWEFEGVTASLVYRDLARLEEEGLVQSFWAASQTRGPARHMYDLTPAGRDHLAMCADDVRGLIDHLTDFLSQVALVDPGNDPLPVEPTQEEGTVKARRRFRKLR